MSSHDTNLVRQRTSPWKIDVLKTMLFFDPRKYHQVARFQIPCLRPLWFRICPPVTILRKVVYGVSFAGRSEHSVLGSHPHWKLKPRRHLHERPIILSRCWCNDIFEYAPVSQNLIETRRFFYRDGSWVPENLFTCR